MLLILLILYCNIAGDVINTLNPALGHLLFLYNYSNYNNNKNKK